MRFPASSVFAVMLVVGMAAATTTADTLGKKAAVQVDALPRSELNEILLETRRRMRHEDPAESSWASLDRAKLARILQMPEFARLPDGEKNHLIDQAGAWELMPFSRPSDAWKLWASWFPDRSSYKVLDPSAANRSVPAHIQSFYADEYWGEQSGAMIALMSCLAPTAWVVRHMDPMVWAVQDGEWSEPGNASFGECVRKQAEDGPLPDFNSPDTRRGLASARIIEDRLSAYLLASGCSGTGPDSCLPLLHALVSLNPANPRLPAIFATLEPSFELGKKYKIQPRPADYAFATCTTTPQRREVLRKIIFLTAKIDLLSQHGQGWKRGELESTLRQLLAHDVVLAQLGESPGLCRDGIAIDRYGFTDPIPRLGKSDAAMWARLGREFSGPDGCRLGETYLAAPKAFNDACGKTRPAAKARRGLTR